MTSPKPPVMRGTHTAVGTIAHLQIGGLALPVALDFGVKRRAGKPEAMPHKLMTGDQLYVLPGGRKVTAAEARRILGAA